jgi:hypothetical protein
MLSLAALNAIMQRHLGFLRCHVYLYSLLGRDIRAIGLDTIVFYLEGYLQIWPEDVIVL